MRVEVTARHIAAGMPGRNTLCPVSLAVREALGRPVRTGQTEICSDPDRWVLDGCLRTRIISYDKGGRMQPFTLELLASGVARVALEDRDYAETAE